MGTTKLRKAPSGRRVIVSTPGVPTLAEVLAESGDAEGLELFGIPEPESVSDAAPAGWVLSEIASAIGIVGNIGRYLVGGGAPGPAVRQSLTATNEAPFEISDGNTLVLPAGFYMAFMNGRAQGNTGGAVLSLIANVPGINLLGSLTLALNEYVLGVPLAGMFTLTEEGALYVQASSDPAPPTLNNCNLYVAQLKGVLTP